MVEEDVEKSEFVTHKGLFTYARIHFLLEHDPGTLQRAVDAKPVPFEYQHFIKYINDVNLF